jgi:hypothetical protein
MKAAKPVRPAQSKSNQIKPNQTIENGTDATDGSHGVHEFHEPLPDSLDSRMAP